MTQELSLFSVLFFFKAEPVKMGDFFPENSPVVPLTLALENVDPSLNTAGVGISSPLTEDARTVGFVVEMCPLGTALGWRRCPGTQWLLEP